MFVPINMVDLRFVLWIRYERFTHYPVKPIVFFTNTTDFDARTTVYLRGAHAPRLYSPLTGKYAACEFRHVRVGGEVYTALELELHTAGCAVLLSTDEEARRALIDVSSLPDETEMATL